MSNYDFERVSVLLAEDSPFIRSLLVNSLKVLGVGNVYAVEDGGDAIHFMNRVKNEPMRVGVQSIDIIMSNWDMHPVDGMMLLRWVRRHKDSVDRFVPFVLITSYTEPERVLEARELGVTEILAKPFTVNNIAEKLISIIERPRQFVHTKDYFGPDRRRRKVPHDGPERRKLTDKSEGVEIIRG
ncbi:response regulator [Eilatimonas milleporae]|uniref:CheY-like chemotaxis protein n=1 Tax=Eilatimonas milleporae TaxID=911205 RepID=A0A3M0CQ15_9PROT|nr:response regulator [Eilatimonas milleporae]RMB08979.1 CheY-like chemotaxis protein [Eilatimonas milleporae]